PHADVDVHAADAPHVEPEVPHGVPPAPSPPSFVTEVRSRRPVAARAGSDFILERDVLTAAPRQDASALLATAPGVYVSRPEGEAVAQEIQLRGFDAEHGQDMELRLGSVPLNQPSHVHGQGYADLGFIIPEAVRAVRVTEGVYDPHQGDFAVAGSATYELGVPERGYHLRLEGGSFGAFRLSGVWAPSDLPEDTFGAVQFRRTQGFGRNRGAQSASGMAQLAVDLAPGVRVVGHVAAHGSRANLAGILRRDDVEAGRVGFYESYATPSANMQSALATHLQAGLDAERKGDTGGRTTFSLWAQYTTLRLRQNFTGFLERSRQRPEWVGRGDLVEQSNRDFALGARAAQHTPRLHVRDWLHGRFELGISARTDLIDQTVNLLQAPQNETWDQRVDARVGAASVGAYADADWQVTSWLRLRGGPRVDALYFDLDDRLGNFIPSSQRKTHLVGYRRTALGLAYGPRGTAELTPFRELSLLASYGEGYRSPQARQLEEGESAPFAKVRSAEVAVRVTPGGPERATLTAAAYYTSLSSDLAFDPTEGALEKVGPTTRRGVAAHALLRPAPWLVTSASVTYVHATLDAPPPATADNPDPPYVPGRLLPYVPPLVARLDTSVHHRIPLIRGVPLILQAGTSVTVLSPRPLPHGQFADPVMLVDQRVAFGTQHLQLGVDVMNAADLRYAQNEYAYVSWWGTSEVPSRIPARHFSAGPPRTVLATLELHL
ncbi:MAG: TonB-dependent receptor, partial [Myxococcota bacterium]